MLKILGHCIRHYLRPINLNVLLQERCDDVVPGVMYRHHYRSYHHYPPPTDDSTFSTLTQRKIKTTAIDFISCEKWKRWMIADYLTLQRCHQRIACGS